MITTFDWLRQDNRSEYAAMHYLMLKICKKLKKPHVLSHDPVNQNLLSFYKEADFYDVKWIMNVTNYIISQHHCLHTFSLDMLHWFNDGYFVPEQFVCNWETPHVSSDKHQYDNRGQNTLNNIPEQKIKGTTNENKYLDFLSNADIYALDAAILRWRIYGRVKTAVENRWFKIKYKMINLIKG